MEPLSRRQFVSALPLLVAAPSLGYCAATAARAGTTLLEPAHSVLFRNVRIFESRGMRMSGPGDALFDSSGFRRTDAVSTDAGSSVIAGKGRTLIPELLETHARILAARPAGGELVELPEWSYVMVSASAQSTLRKTDLPLQVAEQIVSAVDVGIVIAPRLWPKAMVVSGLDGQPGRRGSFVATLPSAYRTIDGSSCVALNPANASYWGDFTSVYASTAHAITAAMPGAGASPANGSERFATMLLVWPARPLVSDESHG